MKKIIPFVMLFAECALISCSGSGETYDATGVFETTEIVVSAEQTGKILQFSVEEGDNISAGCRVGIIDTVQLYLKARKIGATKLVYANQIPETDKQLAELQQQLDKARQEVKRYEKLVNDGAAGSKLLDDAKNQQSVIEKRISATQSTLGKSTCSLTAQMHTADVEQLMIADQLQKCNISSPISGVVLEKYAEPGEFATVGKPLFKVADIGHMFLRAYVTAEQMTSLKIGQKVTVYADQGKSDRKPYEGTVTWITQKAEFTPKTIQTRDERSNLVYAVKISVINSDGLIKSGMYGDVSFH